MAIEYSLQFEPKTSDFEICSRLVEGCGFAAQAPEEVLLGRRTGLAEDERGEMVRFQAPGMLCFFLPVSSLGQEITGEAFGFRPIRRVTFRIDKFENYENGILNMERACTLVIKELAANCVWLANDEMPLLLRKGGHVFLQAREPELRSKLESIAVQIGGEYSFEELPLM